MSVVSISKKNWEQYNQGILSIEMGAEYPLGNDFFQIDHGKNYLAFFERLGRVYYYAWIENKRVAAVAAAILRKIPTTNGSTQAWYLCDLKVHPDFRGKRIPLRLMTRTFPLNYLRCQRGYAISMDPSDNKPNRTVKLLKKFQWLPFEVSDKLLLWSLDKESILKILPLIEKYRGPVSFYSLGGVKDIVLKSTGEPMKLLHAQFGPLGVKGHEPVANSSHMFCSPENDLLAKEILKQNIPYFATATVISHRMSNNDWKWILTSDI